LPPRLRRVPRGADAAPGEHPRRDAALRQDAAADAAGPPGAVRVGAAPPAARPGDQQGGLRGGRPAGREDPPARRGLGGGRTAETAVAPVVACGWRRTTAETAVAPDNLAGCHGSVSRVKAGKWGRGTWEGRGVKCQFCSNPATVHLTNIEDNHKQELHLCQG